MISDYDKQRILRLNNPINGAKIELTRFETRSDSTQTMPCKFIFSVKIYLIKEKGRKIFFLTFLKIILILVTLKTEYAMFGTSCSITSSLHLNPKEKINNLSIRLPILQSWRDAIRADKAFTSITCEFIRSNIFKIF